MKVWITKYALTDGITDGEVIAEHKIRENPIETKIKYLCKNAVGDQFYLDSDDFCYTYEAAIQKAEEMRQKKIESLKKQIKKLEEMRFE